MSRQSRTYTRRKARTRSKIAGTAQRPRLCVTITNKNVIAQIVDDTAGKTLAYSSTVHEKTGGSLSKKAEWAGKDIAKKAKSAKVSSVVLDRGGKLYHGRIKTLADAARENGLEF